MNHLRNGTRFGVILFWVMILGGIYSVSTNINNVQKLGWPTFLFYGATGVVVIYIGAVGTKKLWNI